MHLSRSKMNYMEYVRLLLLQEQRISYQRVSGLIQGFCSCVLHVGFYKLFRHAEPKLLSINDNHVRWTVKAQKEQVNVVYVVKSALRNQYF